MSVTCVPSRMASSTWEWSRPREAAPETTTGLTLRAPGVVVTDLCALQDGILHLGVVEAQRGGHGLQDIVVALIQLAALGLALLLQLLLGTTDRAGWLSVDMMYINKCKYKK